MRFGRRISFSACCSSWSFRCPSSWSFSDSWSRSRTRFSVFRGATYSAWSWSEALVMSNGVSMLPRRG